MPYVVEQRVRGRWYNIYLTPRRFWSREEASKEVKDRRGLYPRATFRFRSVGVLEHLKTDAEVRHGRHRERE